MKRIKEAKLIPVIEVTTVEGDGTDENPLVVIKSYFDVCGKLLAGCNKQPGDR